MTDAEWKQYQLEGRHLRDDQKADWQKALYKQPMVVDNRELEQPVKRLRRLSGWHRIGITASILWLVVGAFWGYKVGDLEGNRTVVYWRFDCIGHNGVTEWDRDGKPINGPPQMYVQGFLDPVTGERLWVSDWCIQQSNKLWPAVNRKTWTYTALYALVPIVLGWLTGYGIIALVRWIRTGFKVPTSPN